MSSLTGKQIANTYKDLLQVSNSNSGIDTTLRSVSDGKGTASPLQLSNAAVNIDGTFQLSGVTLTASASVLNAVADLTGATGMVAVSGGQVYGRTLTAGTGIAITNADGTEGNPTFSLDPSGVVSGNYGPFTNFEVNQYGQVVSATAVSTSVSIPTLRADEIIGGTLTLSSKASIGGDLNVDGAGTIDGIVSLADDLYVSGSTYIGTNLSVTGDTRTDFLYAVSASIEDARIGTLNFTDVSVSSFTAGNLNVTGTVSVGTAIVLAGDNVATSAGLATVSSALATSIATANTRITSVSDYAVALSATMATSINNSNTNIAAVSALTSVNATAITSINTVVDNLDFATSAELAAVSSALATSIATANTRITSVSDYAVALSATFATSINNSNTNIAAVSALTSVNAAAITSINTVVDNLDFATSAELAAVSSALATSIASANSRITSVSDYAVALSATFATSINNSNTNIAVVSALTSVNAAAITSINTVIDNLDYATSAELAAVSSALATSIATANTRITSVSDYTVALSATMATSIANHLPLAGGTLTGQLVGTSATFSGAVCATDYYGDGSNLTGISAVVSVDDDVVTNAEEYPIYVSATGTLSKLKTATSKYTFNPSQGTLNAFQLAASNGILLNSFTVTNSFTIPTGYNALSAGPLTIDAAVTIVVPASSTWVIV